MPEQIAAIKPGNRKKKKKLGKARIIEAKDIRQVTRKEFEKRGYMTFANAYELLRKHGVPGFSSRETARTRIMVDHAIPHEKSGKYCFVLTSAVHELIGQQPQVSAPTEDQTLVKFFLEDPANDFIKATALGISRSLEHAKHIYEIQQEYLRSPKFRNAEFEKQREADRTAIRTRKCVICDRTIEEARDSNSAIVAAVTGEEHRSFALDEEMGLREFVKHRCSECLFWRSTSPVDAMRAKLQFLAEAQNSPEIEIDLSTTANGEGSAKTANGSESATPGASAEEASPLPTTPR